MVYKDEKAIKWARDKCVSISTLIDPSEEPTIGLTFDAGCASHSSLDTRRIYGRSLSFAQFNCGVKTKTRCGKNICSICMQVLPW